jgi:hypothetical protein
VLFYLSGLLQPSFIPPFWADSAAKFQFTSKDQDPGLRTEKHARLGDGSLGDRLIGKYSDL